MSARDTHFLLAARVKDDGPGIENAQRILQGEYRSRTGMGLGILGARRLTDRFSLDTSARHGTSVTIGKFISPLRTMDAGSVAAIAEALARETPNSAYEELQRQNQELLDALDQLRASKAETERLNTELEETNRGVVALYAELDDHASEMRRLSEVKTRFLSDMSHELRTPLTSLINLSRLLIGRSDGDLNSEQERQVKIMQRSAESLVEMVSDLLDIAKIEAGRVELRAEPFRVADLFGTLRGMFRPLVMSDDVSLVFDEQVDICLVSDEQRVSQVLRNLISNAIKFTMAGEIRVGAKVDGPNVLLFVTDTGTGIAPEDQERIFDDFAQVDGPIQRRVRGTGLGLPLTRKLAALLGGCVSVESQVGRGSTFTLTIPQELPLRDVDG